MVTLSKTCCSHLATCTRQSCASVAGRIWARKRQGCSTVWLEGGGALWTLAGSQLLHPQQGSAGLAHASPDTAVPRWLSQRHGAVGEHVLHITR